MSGQHQIESNEALKPVQVSYSGLASDSCMEFLTIVTDKL